MDPVIQKLLDSGLVYENDNGTYDLSEEARDILTEAIEKDPKLFAQWFPDRVN